MKLYQFAHSPYCAKVRKALELKGLAFELVEVPYLDRRELLAVTGGLIQVPVLTDAGQVVVDSARITAYLDERYPPSLRPGALVGLASVFEQWADGPLEDVAFRLAAPLVEDEMAARNGGREDARALYRVMKERKFGAGCIEEWSATETDLGARLTSLLQPLARTLAEQPFLLGAQLTLADVAVWSNLHMIERVMPGRTAVLSPGLVKWYQRVDDARDLRAGGVGATG